MPNLKIYVDETIFEVSRASLHEALPRIRDFLCEAFQVTPSACQLAVIPVLGLSGQPELNIELLILPRIERTDAVIRAAAERLRDLLSTATGAHGAVRVAQLEPATYIALK